MNPERHTAYDYAKDFWLPAFLGVATIVATVWGKSGLWVLGLGLATILASVVLIARVRKRNRDQTQVKARERTASIYYPKFREHVHSFEEFVDTRTNDTLHYMVLNDFTGPVRDEFNKRIGAVPLIIWNQFWVFFKERVDRTEPNFTELAAGVQEFHHLVGQFINLSVAPIFDHLPNEIRAGLTEQQRGRLNGFQQRLTLYLRDYTAFLKELSQISPELDRLPRHFPRVNPL